MSLPPKPMLVSYGQEITRASAAIVGKLYDGSWTFQHKYDGKRCLFHATPKGNRAFSRSGKELKLTPQQAAWQYRATTSEWFDAELVHMRGMRDQAPWVVIFDIVDARPSAFIGRYDRLEKLRDRLGAADAPSEWNLITIGQTADTVRGWWPAQSGFYTDGIIARRKNGIYQAGVRSPDVVKHKFTQISLCYVVSWETGKSRKYGALNLAMARDGNVEYVGKVGTGFTEEQFKILIASKSFPVVEIKHLGFSPHGMLREPIFVRPVP